MAYWSLIVIVLSLIALVWLSLKGANIFFVAPVMAILVGVLSGENALATFTITFMQSFGGYIISNLPIFMTGALFGLLMDKSGNAQALAIGIVNKLGEKRGLLAIVLATAVMVYGGVSLFVVVFAIYPIAVKVFRRANIPKRLIPGTIALGSFTFAAYALPGSPQVQNAMFMPYFGTTLYAAPVLGIIGAIIEFGLGMLWLNGRLNKAWAAGEGFGDYKDEIAEVDTENLPSFIKAFSPIGLFIVLNLIFTYIVFPGMDLSFLENYGTTASSVTGTWALVSAVTISCVCIVVMNLKNFKGQILDLFGKGVSNAIVPISNTAAVIGYGGVIKTLAGFTLVSDLLMGISSNPLIAEVISVNVLSGITGSASGGIGITLGAFADTFIEMANQQGISLEVMHRIGLIASAGLDSLPHNGAIITVLTVCGLTHKQAYKDMFATTVVIPLICTVALIILAMIGIQC